MNPNTCPEFLNDFYEYTRENGLLKIGIDRFYNDFNINHSSKTKKLS